jgi:hypothetical protein
MMAGNQAQSLEGLYIDFVLCHLYGEFFLGRPRWDGVWRQGSDSIAWTAKVAAI